MKWLTHHRPSELPIPPSFRLWHAEEGGTVVCAPSMEPGEGCPGSVLFIAGNMLDLARTRTIAGETVAVLNMANAYRPGGGFRTGRRAQEEELCRQTTLWPRLQASHQHYRINDGKTLLIPDVLLCREGRQSEFRDHQDSLAVRFHVITSLQRPCTSSLRSMRAICRDWSTALSGFGTGSSRQLSEVHVTT